MRCPKCGFSHPDQKTECLRCGVVFRKRSQHAIAPFRPGERKDPGPVLFWRRMPPSPDGRFARWIGVGGLLALSICLLGNPQGRVYDLLHLVNLPFHESGHLVFAPFGEWIASLGGTLMQLLVPLTLLVYFFLFRGDAFAASICLWWFGENFLDIAPYIRDASVGILPLLGGNTGRTSPYGFHDWEFILNEIGCLHLDAEVALVSVVLGWLWMGVGMGWGVSVLLSGAPDSRG